MLGTLLDGRYLLSERIGAGGMGEVWQAYDQRLKRQVAVKTLGGFPMDEEHEREHARRFRREAETVARLYSPHIVTVHDFGETHVANQTVPYLVMEVLRGRPLNRVLDSGRLALPDAARWARQICEALQVAHADGVVHRDLKPGNVMVCDGDLVKVLDFGLARMMENRGESTTLTADGAVVGTPAYMSPEQSTSDRTIDARSDLYSLGCVLYCMVTGRPPFSTGAWHMILRSHLVEPPVPPSQRRHGLPAAWDELILALLEKRREDRPQTAEEVRRRLDLIAELPDRVPSLTAPDAVAPADLLDSEVASAPTDISPDIPVVPVVPVATVADRPGADPAPGVPPEADSPEVDSPEADSPEVAAPRGTGVVAGLVIGVVTAVGFALLLAPVGLGWQTFGALGAPLAVWLVGKSLALVDDDDSKAITGLGCLIIGVPVVLAVCGPTVLANAWGVSWWEGTLLALGGALGVSVAVAMLFTIVWSVLEGRYPRVVRLGVPTSAVATGAVGFWCSRWPEHQGWWPSTVEGLAIWLGVAVLLTLTLRWTRQPVRESG